MDTLTRYISGVQLGLHVQGAKVDGLGQLFLSFADALRLCALESLETSFSALSFALGDDEGHHGGVFGHDALLGQHGVRLIGIKRLQILQSAQETLLILTYLYSHAWRASAG